MNICFDQGVPVPLRRFFREDLVETAYERGWSMLSNGVLIAAVEAEFDAFITTDKNLRYQQNLSNRSLIIVILPTTSWPQLMPYASLIATAVTQATKGAFVEWQFPAD